MGEPGKIGEVLECGCHANEFELHAEGCGSLCSIFKKKILKKLRHSLGKGLVSGESRGLGAGCGDLAQSQSRGKRE